ncbi:hypothetical protein E0K89_010715 [Aquicoccus sp. SCR17]|nr:hypothetical protein [Carideicomes alvinocaridis]
MDIRGLKVLVVEDDAQQAAGISRFLQMTGATVLGPARSLEEALDHSLVADAAVLETAVSGAEVYPVADALVQRDVPFVFYTSEAGETRPKRFGVETWLDKPALLELAEDEPAADIEEGEEPDVVQLLSKLRLTARLVLRDPKAADRLVERTLKEAVARRRAGTDRGWDEGRASWMFTIMSGLLSRQGPRLLQ